MKELRLKQRYTRVQLAKEVGCSASTIVQIERGTRKPSITLAEKIAAKLGTTVDRLFLSKNRTNSPAK